MDFHYHQQQQWIERGVSLGRQLKGLWAKSSFFSAHQKETLCKTVVLFQFAGTGAGRCHAGACHGCFRASLAPACSIVTFSGARTANRSGSERRNLLRVVYAAVL